MSDRRQRRSSRYSNDYEWGDEDRYETEVGDALSRYDRSRYVSGSSRKDEPKEESRSSRRRQRKEEAAEPEEPKREPYYDNFFEDMRIPEEEPRPMRTYDVGANRRYARDTADDVRRRTSRQREDPPADDVEASPKRSRGKKIAVVAACVIAALVVVGAGAAFAYMNSISSNLQEGVDDDLREVLVTTDMAREPFYLLLLGTDGSADRDNDPEMAGSYRSDSMMLARVDAPNKKATLVSISRDTLVDLGEEYGVQKINAAYGIGGPAMAVEAVSDLAGVKISHYAQVDFDGFAALVDALGGVEVDVPIDIDDWAAGGAVSAGLHTLSGDEALILCRSRYTYDTVSAHPDALRAANQRLVLGAIAKKLLGSDIATIASSVNALSEYVITDLGVTDIIGLAQAMQGIDPETDIYTAMEPTNSVYDHDVWCEYVAEPAWTEMMKRIDAGLPPTEESQVDEATGIAVATAGSAASASKQEKLATITLKNGTGIQGLAARTRTTLMDAGFSTVIIGDITEGYQYPATLVVYNEAGRENEATQIVDIIGQGAPFLNDGSYLLADTDFLIILGEDWVS